MSARNDDLLRYYWQELSFLRKMGALFARQHPKIAARLELEPEGCPDPHVERLIESVAFLNGRLQYDLDQDFPRIATEMLGVLHPQLVEPLPSMAIAHLEVDPERGKMTSGGHVARGTRLFARSHGGRLCRFRTTYDTVLWPLEVTEAVVETPALYDFLDDDAHVLSVLRLRLEGIGEDPLHELELDRLRFFLNADAMLASLLYELVLDQCIGLAFVADTGTKQRRAASHLDPVGFADGEEILPYPRHGQPAYRLLQEYFTFPQGFHFFDVSGLSGHGAERCLDLLFLLDRHPPSRLRLEPDTFLLGCTPIINLFEKVSEPIRIDQRRLEYRLVADLRRESTTEVHSVRKVTGTSDPSDPGRFFAPYFSFDHAAELRDQKAFWYGRRAPSLHPDATGSDYFLSFVDLDFSPRLPANEVAFAHLLCTNRDMAENVPAGARLESDEAIPAGRLTCLTRPTRQVEPPRDGQSLWRLVSHLSLNHLSLAEGEDSLPALREILRLYAGAGSASVQHQIQGLRALSYRPVMRRLGSEAWRGFCRGAEVSLTFDEDLFSGSSAFLFATVLRYFFGLYASTNAFTEVVIHSRQRRGEWKRWSPMAGAKRLL